MSLEVRNLTKRYGGFAAVDNVSVTIPLDGLTGIIGPNGAGKTTLFSVVSGVQRADLGEIHFNGSELSRDTPYLRARRGLGRTFQVPRPFSNLTVRENLHVAALHHPGDRLWDVFFRSAAVMRIEQDVGEKATGILDLLQLHKVEEKLASALSGGQRKLLELGRAMMLDPKVMMLDEPFAGVNPVLIGEICECISKLRQRGIGFIIIEHNLGALSRLVERMIVMDRGKILADGEPRAVMADEKVRLAYMGGIV